MFTKNAQIPPKFLCENCSFICSKKSDWDRHISTSKHQKHYPIFTNVYENHPPSEKDKKYTCECGKEYKYRQSMYVHKKTCTLVSSTPQDNNDPSKLLSQEMILSLIQQNKELQQLLIEQNKSITEIAKNSYQSNMINSNNNNNNKTFNLQFFLNETCKDAMNIMDFVDNMKIELTDLENIAQVGYVKGMSNLILKNLKALDVTLRPVHCSDSKREVVYVKDNNEWHNDQKDGEVPNQKLKKAIKRITSKNMKMIPEWRDKYPDCIHAESRKSTLYNNMYYHTVDSSDEHSDKIIKNIAREVVIEK